MKKKFYFFMTILLIVLSVSTFTACFGGNTDEHNKDTTGKLNIDYISSLMADIGDATAFGIMKDNTLISKAKNSVGKMIAYAEETTEEKNYLYKTTEDYSNGSIEYDETGLTKVTFKKNTNVTEEIHDSEGNLISENTTITQNEIPAQINKFYVNFGFTFIQFIPVVNESGWHYYLDDSGQRNGVTIELRPDNDKLILDSEGTPIFDKTDYFSDALNQSFVIDNATGYIYKIENIHIAEINKGLIRANDGLIYDIRIKSNGELEFFSLTENSDPIAHADGFKDNYGNNYIKVNVNPASYIPKANTVFFRDTGSDQYYLSKEGYTLHIKTTGLLDNFPILSEIKILSDDNITDLTFDNSIIKIDLFNSFYIQKIDSEYLYFTSPGLNNVAFVTVNLHTKEKNIKSVGASTFTETISAMAFNYNKVLIWTNLFEQDYRLYYGDIYGDNAIEFVVPEYSNYLWYNKSFTNLSKLSGNLMLEVNGNSISDGNYDINLLKFKSYENGNTIYWIIVINDEGILELIKESELVAARQKVIALQPINK